MMRVHSWVMGVAVVAALVIGAGRADAGPVFTFQIDNTIGDVSGSVTGEIFGLPDNGTAAATSVMIESFPAGLDSLVASPIDATLWDQQYQNTFTVVNGQIVDGHFWAQQTISGFAQGFQLYLNGSPYNFINLDGTDTRYVWGNDGFDAAHFAAASVPEPASLLLMGTGLAGVVRKLRKRGQAA